MVFQLTDHPIFPNPSFADADGLLAVGGDLSSERLIVAYQNGIFPWYSEGEPILWYSPHERFVVLPDEIRISHSMQQFMRSDKYKVTWDKDFTEVINHCARVKRKGQQGTWITGDMKEAYIALHKQDIAHSVEVWYEDKLAGGLYGVESGRVFCGESMFSLMPNASKLALIYLCQNKEYELIDCQMHTPHLESMSGKYISRKEYMTFLKS